MARKTWKKGLLFPILLLFSALLLFPTKAYADSPATNLLINWCVNNGWSNGSGIVWCGGHPHAYSMPVCSTMTFGNYTYDLTNGECGEYALINRCNAWGFDAAVGYFCDWNTWVYTQQHENEYAWPANFSQHYGHSTQAVGDRSNGEIWLRCDESHNQYCWICGADMRPVNVAGGHQALHGYANGHKRTDTSSESRNILVKADKGDLGTYDVTKDKSEAALKELYNSNHTSETYARTTTIDRPNDSQTFTGTVWTITKTHHITHNLGVVESEWDTYAITGGYSMNKNVNYSVNKPTFSQEKYTPLNLNRENVKGIAGNSHATDSDISGFQMGDTNVVGEIDADTETTSGVTDNSYIQGIDTNIDLPFTLKFNNKWYGLDVNKKWDNTPPWETGNQTMNAGESYAKGLNNYIASGNDDRFRWNLFFNGGVTDIYTGYKLTSLYDITNKTEYQTGNYWESEYAPTNNNNWSNQFSARAIYQGTFGTTNAYTETSTRSNYPNWWNLIWQVGRYYEYGIHYEGTIDINGIQQPHQASYNGITTEFTVNGDSINGTNSLSTDGYNQRGLYVTLGQTYQENPLLTGKWQINTMAGDIN